MDVFFVYIFKSSILLSIFYLVYHLLLRKDTFFTIHRYFLLLGIISSLSLPFLEFTTIKFIETPDFYIVNANSLVQTTTISEELPWWTIALVIYLLGILLLIFRFGIQLLSLRKLFVNNHKIKKEGYTFIEVTEDIAPFSFFKTIIYNPRLHSINELNIILKHEKIHVKQYHTIDLLIMNLLMIFLWINPFVWFYKKSLEQNLEFIADRAAINDISSKKEYQLTLVRVFANNYSPIVNNFYQSLIKKRIVMLNKQASQNKNLWKITVILPFLSLFLWGFNTKEVVKIKQNIKINPTISENVIFQEEGKNTAEFIVSKNSSKEDLEKIKKSLKNNYNVAIKFKGIERNNNNEITGIKVDVSSKKNKANYALTNEEPINSFAIVYNSETGKISIGQSERKTDHVWIDNGHKDKAIEIHSDHDNEKHEFIFIGGDKKKKVKDGKVIITEMHEGHGDHFEIHTDDNKTFAYFTGDSDKDPLYFIDGKKATKKEIEKLKTEEIETMEVSKGKAAIKKYGKDAENGVIEITTKKK